MKFNSLPVAIVSLVFCFFILTSSDDNCGDSPVDLCTNGILDPGEEQVDCGGNCPDICPPDQDLCNNNMLDPGEEKVDCGGTCPETCEIRTPDIDKELMITDLSIIDSPEATNGVLSFGHLMKQMAKSDSDADVKEFIIEFFKNWESTNTTVNGFTIAARPNIRAKVINPWIRRDHNGTLVDIDEWDIRLENAPFRLMAITSRVDLHKLEDDDISLARSGEGRFTYCLVNTGNNSPEQFTIIFEYHLPGTVVDDLVNWAKWWHHLGSFDSFNNEYKETLTKITGAFTDRNKMPSAPNGSAIAQIRTNENALSAVWELREFNVDSSSGLLKEVTRKQTPDVSFNSGPKEAQLANFLNANGVILDSDNQTLTIPTSLSNGTAFMAGDVFTQGLNFEWTVNGVTPQRVQKFSLETCNGCHGASADTGPFNPTANVSNGGPGFTTFTHIKPRFPNERTVLSNFLAGEGNPDNNFENELDKRVEVMQSLMGELQATSDEMDKIIAFIKSRGNRTH